MEPRCPTHTSPQIQLQGRTLSLIFLQGSCPTANSTNM